MPSSDPVRVLAPILVAALLGGCAMSPEELAYRDRLELGIVTPEDSVRFKTPEREHLALVADARTILPRPAQGMELQLMQAARAGDLAGLRAALARGARVDAVDEWGNSALLQAAREAEVENARLLLKAGASVDGRGGAMTPLAAAALRGHTMMVRLLIGHGADVDAVGENGLTALMNAVKLGHPQTAQLLLEAGANTRVRDRAGNPLPTVAVQENRPDMLALLLKLGVPADLADPDGLTALYWAEYLGRPRLARMLRDAGAEPGRKKKEVLASEPYTLGEFGW